MERTWPRIAAWLRQFAARAWGVARVILFALGLLALLALVVALLPRLLAHGTFVSDAERLKAENDVRATLLQALAGAFLLLGLYFTARTLQLNREGQITERFTRAIDQLGHANLDVRLGGIYALERIAKDSQRDRETIFEVLAAFIREHSQDPQPSTEDLRATAAVLARRARKPDDRRLNLRGAHLPGISLDTPDFNHADLSEANLQDAVLRAADLRGALLIRANLKSAILEDANLAYAFLTSAELSGAMFLDADLLWADLRGATYGDKTFLGAKNVDRTIRDQDGRPIPDGRSPDAAGSDSTASG